MHLWEVMRNPSVFKNANKNHTYSGALNDKYSEGRVLVLLSWLGLLLCVLAERWASPGSHELYDWVTCATHPLRHGAVHAILPLNVEEVSALGKVDGGANGAGSWRVILLFPLAEANRGVLVAVGRWPAHGCGWVKRRGQWRKDGPRTLAFGATLAGRRGPLSSLARRPSPTLPPLRPEPPTVRLVVLRLTPVFCVLYSGYLSPPTNEILCNAREARVTVGVFWATFSPTHNLLHLHFPTRFGRSQHYIEQLTS